jgi:low temperature requirement protein LtrA
MMPRDREEEHRTATPLELLFDLCFVVPVASAAAGLHHGLAAGHASMSVLGYLSVFFAIWWAWMNFTWFASAYDTDDVPYRLITLVQIAGVLVLAAGVPAAFARYDFTTITIGYVIMRVAMVGQWLRVAREHAAGRSTALRLAAGIAVCQLGWLARLALPKPWAFVAFGVLVIAELAVPIWAETSGRPTSWHPEHMAERYGLFTIIVLGEVVLAATTAIRTAVVAQGISAALLATAGGGLLLVFGLWWSYFKRPAGRELALSLRLSFGWGYAHYAVFASVAALGAGLGVAAQTITGGVKGGPLQAGLSVAVPVAIYLVVVGILQTSLDSSRPVAVRFGVVAALVLAGGASAAVIPLSLAVVLMGLLVWCLIAIDIAQASREHARRPATERG